MDYLFIDAEDRPEPDQGWHAYCCDVERLHLAAEDYAAGLEEALLETREHNMAEACDECNERLEAAEARAAQLEAALKDDVEIINRWKSATAAEQVRALDAEHRIERAREALELIVTHAELDLYERRVGEAARYVGIAKAALDEIVTKDKDLD